MHHCSSATAQKSQDGSVASFVGRLRSGFAIIERRLWGGDPRPLDYRFGSKRGLRVQLGPSGVNGVDVVGAPHVLMYQAKRQRVFTTLVCRVVNSPRGKPA